MDITVVIPYFGRRTLLLETLQSIAAQTLQPREIIIIDDGSDEPLLPFPDQVAGSVPLVTHRTTNNGTGVARNIGVDHARSDWIAFCDSDDIWLPRKLEAQAEAIKSDPALRYCVTNFRYMVNGEPDATSKFEAIGGEWWDGIFLDARAEVGVAREPIYRKLLQFNPIFPSALLIAKSLYRDVGQFNPRFARHRTEDYEFHLRCSEHPPLAFVREPLVHIRRHAQNYSGSILKNLLSDLDILEYARTNHRSGPEHRELIDAVAHQKRLDAIGLAFEDQNTPVAKQLARAIDYEKLDFRTRAKLGVATSPACVRAPLYSIARAGAKIWSRVLGRSKQPPAQ